jgi:hypothetical protein
MRSEKVDEHTEHRRKEHERANASETLAAKFPELKSLTMDVAYYAPDTMARNAELKYTVNIDAARSVFRLDCPNQECVRGDFDLSHELAGAVSSRRETVSGQMACEGWLSKTTINARRCGKILRYNLKLAYK